MTQRAPATIDRDRPHGRARSEARILEAALELLLEVGPKGTTIEGIAKRAGVSKVTLYRWWPTRAAVIMSAFLQVGLDQLPYFESVDRRSLVNRLGRMAREFCGPTGQMIKALVGEAQFDPQVAQAFRTGYIEARRTEGRVIIEQAMADGQIRKADPAVVLDLIYAPLWFRLLIGHEPLNQAFVRAHVDLVLSGLTP